MPNELTPLEMRRQQAAQALANSREADSRQRHAEHVQALVERIHKIRSEVDGGIAQLQEAALELRSVCRRNYDEASASLLVFANSHIRLAGALGQGVRRTISMDRVLANAAQEREEAKRREAEFKRQQEVREHKKLVQNLQLPAPDDFDDLYGEIVNDAAE